MAVTTKYLLAIALLGCVLSDVALARDKTDIVWMTNGDRLTGEIKQLEHGKLRLSTDAMGEVRIEWDEISRIESDYAFQFERTDGTRVTGTVKETTEERKMRLADGESDTKFAHENVIRISQIENSFWERVKGSLALGYSFTKASNVAQGNFSGRATHRTEIRSFTVDGSTIITSDQNDDSTQRSDLQLNMTRFRQNRWFNSYLLGFESNDELGLDLRTSFGMALGRYLVQTNTSELALLGGAVGTAETLQGGASPQESIEGLVGLDYSRYVYDHPAVDLSARLNAFPSFTNSGRVRAQLDLSLRWEIINDLFWDLSYYNTYDSDPPSGSESTTDYGIVTSIGWSF
jgi:hypothetical protein